MPAGAASCAAFVKGGRGGQVIDPHAGRRAGEAVCLERPDEAAGEGARAGGGRHGRRNGEHDGDGGDDESARWRARRRRDPHWLLPSGGGSLPDRRSGPPSVRSTLSQTTGRGGARQASHYRGARQTGFARREAWDTSLARPRGAGSVRDGLARGDDAPSSQAMRTSSMRQWRGRVRGPGVREVGRHGDVDRGRLEPDAVVADDEAYLAGGDGHRDVDVARAAAETDGVLAGLFEAEHDVEHGLFGNAEAAQERRAPLARRTKRRGFRGERQVQGALESPGGRRRPAGLLGSPVGGGMQEGRLVFGGFGPAVRQVVRHRQGRKVIVCRGSGTELPAGVRFLHQGPFGPPAPGLRRRCAPAARFHGRHADPPAPSRADDCGERATMRRLEVMRPSSRL